MSDLSKLTLEEAANLIINAVPDDLPDGKKWDILRALSWYKGRLTEAEQERDRLRRLMTNIDAWRYEAERQRDRWKERLVDIREHLHDAFACLNNDEPLVEEAMESLARCLVDDRDLTSAEKDHALTIEEAHAD
jgi:hypothetical protein